MRKQSCSLPCHCKAVRNTLANTQVSPTSKTRPHARNNWGTWRGHNNQLTPSTFPPFFLEFDSRHQLRSSSLHRRLTHQANGRRKPRSNSRHNSQTKSMVNPDVSPQSDEHSCRCSTGCCKCHFIHVCSICFGPHLRHQCTSAAAKACA